MEKLKVYVFYFFAYINPQHNFEREDNFFFLGGQLRTSYLKCFN
jgi:hypothetical protein